MLAGESSLRVLQSPLPWNAANPKQEDETAIEFGALGEESLLSDTMFEDTSSETEAFASLGDGSPLTEDSELDSPAEADDSQVGLRVAPQTLDAAGNTIPIPQGESSRRIGPLETSETEISFEDEMLAVEALAESLNAKAAESEEGQGEHQPEDDELIASLIAPELSVGDQVQHSMDVIEALQEEETSGIVSLSSFEQASEESVLSGIEFNHASASALLGDKSLADESDGVSEGFESTISIEQPSPGLVGESAPLKVLDDPFDEQFEAEEIVIKSRAEPIAVRVRVEGGEITREFAELLPTPAPEGQNWTIDVEATEAESTVEVAQADTPRSFIAEDGAIVAADSLLSIAPIEAPANPLETCATPASEGQGEGQPQNRSPDADSEASQSVDNELFRDQQEWEPGFSPTSGYGGESLDLAPASQQGDPRRQDELLLDDGDMIILDDEESLPSNVGTPKARAVVRDYRRLFAQLRGGCCVSLPEHMDEAYQDQ